MQRAGSSASTPARVGLNPRKALPPGCAPGARRWANWAQKAEQTCAGWDRVESIPRAPARARRTAPAAQRTVPPRPALRLRG